MAEADRKLSHYNLRVTHDSDAELARALYQTVRYFDLFEQPVTVVQMWRTLVIQSQHSPMRWAGRQVYSLSEVRLALKKSARLKTQLGWRWGYYFLVGREQLVSAYQLKHRLAQTKWKLTRRVARWFTLVPFVRMIAMSGSLAAGNTKADSDLDLFVVVAAGRIWTARLGLLVVSQLSGRRRKYWDRKAPDKICLNHYVTETSLAINSDIRNLYTAVLYQKMVCLFWLDVFQNFQQANAAWSKRFLMYPEAPRLKAVQAVQPLLWLRSLKSGLEKILLEPVGEAFERWAERVQRRRIAEHTMPGQRGRVVLSAAELAFHPDTKVPSILAAFAQEEGQGQLL
ncbi:hypothetical protein IH781_02590 [Patescibacteria group bacterium]|nr:hypothetical protein [Patescibacteria group bacterium]